MYKSILGMRVDITSLNSANTSVRDWLREGKGRYVCVSNVHMCMETFDNPKYRNIVNSADLVVPDGRPLVWAQKLLGTKDAQQVRGMDLMMTLCEISAKEEIPIGFYGSTTELLEQLKAKLKTQFPDLIIDCSIAPPFRQLEESERLTYLEKINKSGIKILFVGLGCPKQEIWMAENRDNLNCVMFGVGAAFDFIAGNKKHAPRWIQKIGLEWLFRLMSEPKRLWKRYLKQNPRFLYYFAGQLLGRKYE